MFLLVLFDFLISLRTNSYLVMRTENSMVSIKELQPTFYLYVTICCMAEVLTFPSKRIIWKFGNYAEREILLQCKNGPCPLLSLINVLSLRGAITLSNKTLYTSDEIIEVLRIYLIKQINLV